VALDTKFYVQLIANYQGTVADFTTATALASYAKSIPLTTGTAANQADKYWSDQRTISASGTDDLDLAGVLTDLISGTTTFVRVKGLVIYAASANANNVIVGNAASNAWNTWVGASTHTVTVRPGGLLALWAPDGTAYAVTAGTGDILRIANSGAGTSVTYDIHVIGASA
jgi:hypothetical protein